jgi:hypothetical protein
VDPVVQLDRAAARPQLWNRYSYALNNPLAFVDPTGRIVNLASMTAEDRQTLIAQLSEKTGLRLTYDEKAGNLVVLGIISDDSGKATGSKIARRDLLTAIGSDKTVYGLSRNGSDTINLGRRVGPHLYLDFDDIALIETGRNDPGTFDAGMIFLHELKHHQGLRDPSEAMLRRRPTLQGQTVAHMNKIRRELGLPLRAQYATDQDSDGRDFLPFTNGPIYVPTGIAQ